MHFDSLEHALQNTRPTPRDSIRPDRRVSLDPTIVTALEPFLLAFLRLQLPVSQSLTTHTRVSLVALIVPLRVLLYGLTSPDTHSVEGKNSFLGSSPECAAKAFASVNFQVANSDPYPFSGWSQSDRSWFVRYFQYLAPNPVPQERDSRWRGVCIGIPHPSEIPHGEIYLGLNAPILMDITLSRLTANFGASISVIGHDCRVARVEKNSDNPESFY